MKKSDLKLLQDRNRKAVTPSAQKKEDASDELTALFDDGTKLGGAPATQAQSTLGTQSTQSTLGTHTAPTASQLHSPASPVAPARDFMKVANSISRDAVPAGLFKGKAKQIYDYLYSKTRGAIVPARTVRLTRREIMEGSHIGSTKTLYLNLQHLRAVGLVECQEIVGPHGGNEYTVYLPEEARGTQSTMSTQSTSSDSSQKVVGVLGVESTLSTHSLSVDRQGTSAISKTLIQDKDRSDDEAFADFIAAFNQLTCDLTGKQPAKADAAQWRELAEIITTEARIAAGRTTVSSVPAFLAEHLRRRLFKKDKAQLKAEVKSEPTARADQGLDASKCPDCFGTRMYYPEGFEKGVVRCTHPRLSTPTG